MPRISRNLVAYLACLIVVTLCISWTANTSARGLGKAHTDLDLKVLKLATDEAYIDFLQRKLVEWYADTPKSDCHAPGQEENDGKVSEAGKEGEGEAGCWGCWQSVHDAFNVLVNHCKPKRTDRRRGRAEAAFD